MRVPPLVLALSLLASTATATVTHAAPKAAGSCARPVSSTQKRIAIPAYATGAETTAFLADRARARRLYVTNGQVVLRTDDEGCRWTSIYTAPANASVTQLTGGFASAPGWVVLLVTRAAYGGFFVPNPDAKDGNLLLVSSDAGAHWTTYPAGSRGLGTAVLVAPSDPKTMYVAVASTLDVTTDGGETWTTRLANTADYAYFGTANPRAVDPRDPRSLWFLAAQSRDDAIVLNSGKMMHSADGGATATVAGSFNPRSLWVQRPAGRPAVITAPSGHSSHAVYESTDGGKTFRETAMPPPNLALQFARTDRTATMYAGVWGPGGCNVADANGHRSQCYNRILRFDPRVPRWVIEHQWPQISSTGNGALSLQLGTAGVAYYLRAGNASILKPDRTGYDSKPVPDELLVLKVAT